MTNAREHPNGYDSGQYLLHQAITRTRGFHTIDGRQRWRKTYPVSDVLPQSEYRGVIHVVVADEIV
jgi:hypothetical protein